MKKLWMWHAAAASLAVMASAPSSAGTGHQWGNYKWYNESGDVTLTLEYKFRDSRWLQYHGQSLGQWENNSQSPLDLVDGGENGAINTKKCDPVQGRIIVCSDNYGNRGWLGIASITASGNFLTSATVRYNDSFYSTARYNTPDERTFVTCHEIGHTFGLGHLDENFGNTNLGSCMDYTSNPAGPPDNRDPGTVDWNVLNSSTMYGTFDTGGDPNAGGGGGGGGGGGPPPGKGPKFDPFEFRTVGSAPPAQQEEAAEEWGRIIGYDGEGRPNKYRLDLPNGRHKITHVLWAEGFRPQGSLRR